jgi:SAM-dependent methyltransferase
LPFEDASFEAVWSLGVLCTTRDQVSALTELRRITGPGGLVGLLVYLKTVQELPEQPEGNDFPTEQRLAELLEHAELEVLEESELSDFAVPEAWQLRADAVADLVAERHGHDARWVTAEHQRRTMLTLLQAGLVRPRLLVARRR